MSRTYRVGVESVVFNGGGDAEVEGLLIRQLSGMTFLVELELGGHGGHAVAGLLEFLLQLVLLGLEELDLLAFAFSRVVGGQSVALHALNPALLLLVFGLGPLSRGQVGLGLGEDLAPRLAFLDRLAAL